MTGEVTAVYQRTETTGDSKYTWYVVHVRVEECENGDTVKKGDLVYAGYWLNEWIGKVEQPPSHSGHLGLWSHGQSLHVHMLHYTTGGLGENNDGGFGVIGPNGFGKLEGGSSK